MTTFNSSFEVTRINKLSTELAILDASIKAHEEGYNANSYQEFILKRDNMIKKKEILIEKIAEIAMGAE